jgi:hypothetical protein
MDSNKLEDYLALLTIRRAARRRDTVIAGAVFFVSVTSMLFFGLLNGLNGRSVYLVAAVIIALGFSYLTAWVRLEIIKGSIELIDNFQRWERGGKVDQE